MPVAVWPARGDTARDLADTPGMGPHAHPANTVEDQMDELVVFFTAGRCSLLRKRIGIAIRQG